MMMDDGEILEIGTHDELVARDGSYADLWQSQMTATNGEVVDSAVRND